MIFKYILILVCSASLVCQGQMLTRQQRIDNARLMRQIENEDFKGIITVTEKVLSADSNNTKALFYKALAEYRINNTQAAYKDFALYFHKRPNSLANMYMAEVNLKRGDTASAIKNIEVALAYKGSAIMVCDNMGKLWPVENKKLIKLWYKAAETNPDNFVAWAALGIHHEKTGNVKKSDEYYTKATNTLNHQLSAYYRVKYRWMHILKAESAYRMKKYNEAITAINSSILLFPEDVKDYHKRIKYFLAKGDQKNACRDEYVLAKVGDGYMPKQGDLFCNYKDDANKPQKEWLDQVEAEKRFIKAAKLPWGDTTAQRIRFNAFFDVTHILPTHIYAIAEVAQSTALLYAPGMAVGYYDVILLVDSTKHQAWNKRAQCKSDFGNFEGALKDATRAIQLDSTESQYWATRAGIKIHLLDSAGAEQDLTVAIKLNPTNSTAYFNRGLLLMEQRKYQLALNDFLKAIDIEEDQPLGTTYAVYYNNSAMAYKMLKQYDKAMEHIDYAIASNPSNPMFYFRSGEIKAMMKDMKGACEDWNIAKKLGYKDAEEVLHYNCNEEKK